MTTEPLEAQSHHGGPGEGWGRCAPHSLVTRTEGDRYRKAIAISADIRAVPSLQRRPCNPRPFTTFEVARLSPHVVPGGGRVVVAYEYREPFPDRLEIFRAQRVIRVGDASVVGTDGQIEIAVCLVRA